METSDPKPDNELLLEAFNTFSEASLQLEKAYNDLQEHTRALDLELTETNEKLKHSLIEQERTSLQLRGVLDAMTTGILELDLEGMVQTINPSARKMFNVAEPKGHYQEMGLPKPIVEFVYNCIESTLPRVPNREMSVVVDGEQMDLDVSFTLVRPKGGGIMSVLILLNDITLINRLQSQAKRNVRLAAMGEMAAELAHEIRNPLGSIKLFAGLLEKDLEGRESGELAGQISHGVQILESIVANILTFSANVDPRREPIAVADLLTESLPLFELERNRKKIHLDFHPPETELTIMGDTHLLKQVILNLCNNAIKAMEPSGRLQIRAKARDEFAEIVIADNGKGIPEEQLPKIFDPFFTTFQGGTGLGLSVVNQIIEKHEGAIDFSSTVGEGTTVIVSLPAAGGEVVI
ncbi:MAG: ATP-binding protein [Acidobacteriota bacterium]|nr:ATP-binding protein [Acidobacteriota bacterium]